MEVFQHFSSWNNYTLHIRQQSLIQVVTHPGLVTWKTTQFSCFWGQLWASVMVRDVQGLKAHLWYVGFPLEKNIPQTHMCVHEFVYKICSKISWELQIPFLSIVLFPFTYKIKREMSWHADSLDCACRSKCGLSCCVSGRGVEMLQRYSKFCGNRLWQCAKA